MSSYGDPWANANANPDQINPVGGINATVSPQQLQQTQTLLALQQNHPWMPMQTAAAISTANIDPVSAVAMGNSLRDVAKQGVDAVKTIRDDPVLEKQPSNLMIMNQYINHSVGALPIEQQHLVDVQKNLQQQGFGQDLEANGVFSPEWYAAYKQSYYKAVNDQLAGAHHPGSTTFGHALGWLKNTLPKEAANTIIGYVTHMPNEIKKLAGDMAGGVAGGIEAIGETPGIIDTAALGGDYHQAAAEAGQRIHNTTTNVGSFVERNAGVGMGVLGDVPSGGPPVAQTPEQYQAEISANPGGRLVEDVGNFLNVASIGQGGAGIAERISARSAANAAATEATDAAAPSVFAKARMLADPATPIKDVGLDEATIRRPGNVASIAGRMVKTTAGRVTLGSAAGYAYGAYHGDTGAERLRDAAIGGGAAYLGSYAYNNVSILSRTGPWVAHLADENGLYYRMRTAAALPYEYAPVRAAGSAISKAGAVSAGLHLEAQLSPGDQTGFTSSIQDSHVIDPLDDAVRNKLQFSVLGKQIQPNIDWLAVALHPPAEGPGTTSAWLSRNATDIHKGLNDSIGETNFVNEYQRALGKGVGIKDLIQKAGGQDDFNIYLNNKVKTMASSLFADERLAEYERENGALHDLDRRSFLRNAASDARSDPVILDQQVKKLVASPGTFTNMIRREAKVTSAMDDGAELTAAEAGRYIDRDLGSYMKAVHIGRDHLVNNQDFLLGPHTGVTEDADAEAAAQAAGGVTAPPKKMLGIATSDHLTIDVAQNDVAAFLSRFDEYNQARGRLAQLEANVSPTDEHLAEMQTLRDKTSPKAYDALVHDMHTYFHKEFLVDPLRLAEQDPSAQLDILQKYAEQQAAPAILADGAPAHMPKAIDDLAALGYKPVYGTDIGHILLDDPMIDLGKPLSTTRKIISNIGMNTERFDARTQGSYRKTSIEGGWQQDLNSGKYAINAPFKDAQWMYSEMKSIVPEPNLPQRLAGAIASRRNDVESLAKAIQDHEGVSEEQALATAKQTIQREAMGIFQPWDVPHDQFIKRFTRDLRDDPSAFEALQRAANSGEDPTAKALIESGEKIPLMSTDHAEQAYRAMVKNSADMPGYMMGAEHLADLMRVGGPFGWVGDHLPGNVGYKIANVPNEMLKLRNQLRFQLSPSFSVRRLLKTNMKLAQEGVTSTATPLHDMMEAGTLDEDLGTLDRIFPHMANKDYDDAVRTLASNDVFGIYNHRNLEARAAGELARKGLSDDEIALRISRATGYGTYGGEAGRTAAERTANIIFFPFSFDKTVYRNMSAYMLDHPAQMMTLNNALSTYKAYDADHHVTQRILDQVPLANEALRLNMFAHGVSLGEFGGINAPFMNLFLPQSWSSDAKSSNTLERFLPQLKDAQRVGKELGQQKRIVFTGGHNLSEELHGNISFDNPVQATGTDNAQYTAAGAYKRKLYSDYADVLDYNSGNTDDPYRIPDDKKFGKYRNEVITKTLLQQIVADKYPAYDPAGGSKFMADHRKELENYQLSLNASTSPYAAQEADFVATANKASTALNDDSYTSDEAQTYTDAIRQNAIWLAERDPEFYKAYNKFYVHDFGPLESQQYG